MSNVAYFCCQANVNLPVCHAQASPGVPFSNESSESGVGHPANVPLCPSVSGLMRSLTSSSAAPCPLLSKLPRNLVSGTASGSFRSTTFSNVDIDLNNASASNLSFPLMTCCRSIDLSSGNGIEPSSELDGRHCSQTPTRSDINDVEPMTVDELAYSLPATGAGCSEEVERSFPVAAVVDCRAFVAFNVNHVTSAFNASCGDRIAQKRLLSGRATVADFVSGGPVPETETHVPRDHFKQLIRLSAADGRVIVAYDDNATCMTSLPATHPLRMVTECLRKAGAAIKYLQGGLQAFYAAHPRLCSKPNIPPSRPLLYSPTTPVVEMDVDSTEMSPILPFIFIGNERDAANRELLEQSKITHVLNVTSHIPQFFEDNDSVHVVYKRLAASDSCSQNLKQYFEEAIIFIESARTSGGRVLVHCQAGVSRSPTIVIAYLMARSNWTLMMAFDFVKSRRNIIAPNLHFMGQLLEFESRSSAGQLRHCLNDDDDGQNSFQIPALPENASS